MNFADLPTFAPREEAPLLHADGLVLRGHVLSDFDVFWHFYQTTKRAAYVGAPRNTTHLWYGLSAEILSWKLHGIGGWAIELDGQFVGQIAIAQQPHFPEIEIGWTLFDGFEGQGIAHRAAACALDWFWENTPADTLVSYITPENTRSIALAKRLGATHDPQATLPTGETPEETAVYRHRRPA